MTNWVWLNIPLCAVAFLATVGIPVWLTFKDPDQRPGKFRRALPAHINPRGGRSASTGWQPWQATAEEELVEARPRQSVN
jgi:hypothetical protein